MSAVGAAFSFFTPEEAELVERRMQARGFLAGEVILEEGDRRRAIFVIDAGRARVDKEHMGARVPIAYMTGGEIFGEISFLDDRGASASVVADTDCQVRVLESAEVDPLLLSDAGFASHFYRSLAVRLSERLRERSQHLLPVMSEG